MSNENYYNIESIQKVAPKRLPGYMEALASIGREVRYNLTGPVIGYYLTNAQELELSEKFNPDPAATEKKRRRMREAELLPPDFEEILGDLLDQKLPHDELPGYADLLTMYEEELGAMDLDNCSNCEINALRLKYREMLKTTLLESTPAA